MNLKQILSAALALLSFGAVQAEKPANTIGTIVYKVDNIDHEFKFLRDNGFTSCEVQWYYDKATPELARQIKEASKKHNIKVTTLVGVPGHSEWNFINGPSTIGLVPAEGREAKMVELAAMIDFATAADIPAVHTHFGFIPEDPSSQQYKDLIEAVKPLATYAKNRGRMIYFETGQETPVTLRRAIRDIGTDNLGINCDVANLMMYGKANPVDAIRQFGPLVKELHAKDGCYPTDPSYLGAEKPIPEGDVDFPGVIRELKKIGFNGAYTIEYELTGDSRDYLVKTRLYLQNLINKQ